MPLKKSLRIIKNERGRPALNNRDCVPMAVCAQLRSHSLALVSSALHQLVHQVVGNAVAVRVKGDVMVHVDSVAEPFAQVETRSGKRTQSWLG